MLCGLTMGAVGTHLLRRCLGASMRISQDEVHETRALLDFVACEHCPQNLTPHVPKWSCKIACWIPSLSRLLPIHKELDSASIKAIFRRSLCFEKSLGTVSSSGQVKSGRQGGRAW